MKVINKSTAREKRRKRGRQRIIGTPVRPRLNVFRSLKHLYVQLINDIEKKTLVACATVSPEFKKKFTSGKNNIEAARNLGEFFAEEALSKGIKKVVFDRAGYKYHGRVKALADSARKKGLQL